MKAYWFRFINDTSALKGIAVAKDMKELFWQIDEHGDPFSCMVSKIKDGASILAETSPNCDYVEIVGAPDEGWKKINWKKHDIYGRHNIEVELEK